MSKLFSNIEKLTSKFKTSSIQPQKLLVRSLLSKKFGKQLYREWTSRTQAQQVLANWRKNVLILKQFEGISVGNTVDVYHDGPTVFDTMYSEIDKAKKRVWMETYILTMDETGKQMVSHLVSAARRGCDVLLVYDHMGSYGVETSYLKQLEDLGAQIVCFNQAKLSRFLRPWKWRHLRTRNHRKILVIDGSVAFCGGMNVAREYSHDYRDTHAKGPAVKALAATIYSSVKATPDGDVSRLKKWETYFAYKPREGGVLVQVLKSDGKKKRQIQKAWQIVLSNATKICITTPYLIPTRKIKNAIGEAAKREGTEVCIMTAGKCDVMLARSAAVHVYGYLLKQGVKIWELQNRELHAKTATMDGVYSSIGSFNLDHLSYNNNHEANLTVFDSKTSQSLFQQFEVDKKNAKEITLKDWESRNIFVKSYHYCIYQIYAFFVGQVI